MICGFCADKNISDCLRVILQHTPADHIRLINSSHPRSMKADRLREVMKGVNQELGLAWDESECGGLE